MDASARHPRRRRLVLIAAAAFACWAGGPLAGATAATPQAERPDSLDPAPLSAPYSYLQSPTDQLGVPGYRDGTEVLPTADLYNGWAEMYVRVGPRRRSFPAASRALEQGRYPIIRHTRLDTGVGYTMTAFCAPVAGRPVTFVRVEMVNTTLVPRTAYVRTGVRNNGGSFVARGTLGTQVRAFRFPRPIAAPRLGLYAQGGWSFNPKAVYSFEGDALVRDGEVVYDFPPASRNVSVTQSIRPGSGPVVPASSIGQNDYRIVLAPGAHAQLDFHLPNGPPAAGSPQAAAIASASFDAAHARTAATWRRLLGRAMQLDLPERKAEDAFYASIMQLALARYQEQGWWIQTVNMLRYHSFYLRDAAIYTNMFDMVGLSKIASEDLAFFLTWQQDDGLFISRPQEYDGFGQALWAFGDHYQRTRSPTFLRTVYPSVKRAMAWFHRARAADPMGLMPAADRADNEAISGHITGDDFWAYAGINEAIAMAKAIGDQASVRTWSGDLALFRGKLVAAVKAAAARNGGWLGPALDVSGGQYWGELWASYIGGFLSPRDPIVTATLDHVRSTFREGIATYADGRALHSYIGFRVFQTELLRGEQNDVVKGFYDELAHTSSTHASFETGIAPYGDRTVRDATAPHGWFSAEYVALLRNMLVRESGDRDIVLGSAIPPAWIQPGRHVGVRGAPTKRGRVSWTLTGTPTGATLRWNSRLRAGTRLLLAVPAGARGVKAKGLSRDGRTIRLRGRRGTLKIGWSRFVGPMPTFRTTVRWLTGLYASGSGGGGTTARNRGPVPTSKSQ